MTGNPATIVFFHAHPDDETLFTGGTMARAAAEGHRVVLVTATRGERGTDRAGVVQPGESLAERRETELRAAAKLLDVHRCEILGYADSGLDGAAVDGFCRAGAEEVAGRLADIMVAEGAQVLVIYDEQGIYGHPDHVQAHKVGLRAAQLADVAAVYLATLDRDHLNALVQLAPALGLRLDGGMAEVADRLRTAGVAGERITAAVDVSAYLVAKREALAAHETQVAGMAVVLALPPPAFQLLFGTEWYVGLGVTPGATRRPWLFAPDPHQDGP
jgi:LmbE family N-acetylglucosaminyl deacetylase